MLGLLLRVFFRFYIGFFLILNIASTLSDVVIETDVGSTDKITFPNTTCQVVSGKRLCQSFGARLQNGERCSCLCPEDANTFGFDGETCKCLPNNISYGGKGYCHDIFLKKVSLCEVCVLLMMKLLFNRLTEFFISCGVAFHFQLRVEKHFVNNFLRLWIKNFDFHQSCLLLVLSSENFDDKPV